MTVTATGMSWHEELRGPGWEETGPALSRTVVRRVDDPGLREVLGRFEDAALGAPLAALRSLRRDRPGTTAGADGDGTLPPLTRDPAARGVGAAKAVLVGVVTLGLWGPVTAPIAVRITRTTPWDESAAPTERAGGPDSAEPEPAGAPATDDAVRAVQDLTARLGVARAVVLDAVGISTSTFHTWTQGHSPRPRLASQGRLWELVRIVDGIEAVAGVPVRPWLLADPARVRRLRNGEFDALAAEASAGALPDRASAPGYAAAYAVGADLDAARDQDDLPPAEAGPARARTRTAATATAGRRRRVT